MMTNDFAQLLAFYKGKRVFVTGHTGFKGVWLCCVLLNAGAYVAGYALEPAAHQDILFSQSGILDHIVHQTGDIRCLYALEKAIQDFKPEIVIHLAAQPLVKEGYRAPIETYEVNVMGTLNLFEAIRNCPSVRSVLNVTTDKVYLNKGDGRAYSEDDVLNGSDPYSNSKSCSELLTHCYRESFFNAQNLPISTARAGNVIGGGDFTPGRIIPDCIQAIINNTELELRQPHSVRPYQHVLEAVFAYLLICQQQYLSPAASGAYNVAPTASDCITTIDLVKLIFQRWGRSVPVSINGSQLFTEADCLRIDNARLYNSFGWRPVWHIAAAAEKVVEWTMDFYDHNDLEDRMRTQILEYVRDSVKSRLVYV